MKMTRLSEKHIRLLYALDHELEYMKTKLSLVEILKKYPHNSKHPVLNFAVRHAINNVIEWLILQFNEAINPYLNSASKELLGKPIFTKKGRDYESDIEEIPYILKLCDKNIAHRIANLDIDNLGNDKLLKTIELEYGNILNFLRRVIVVLEKILQQLKEKGLYEGVNNLIPSYPKVDKFTDIDLDRLVKTANTLV